MGGRRARVARHRRILLSGFSAFLVLSAAMQPAPAEDNLGEWSAPFTEDGRFVTAPPANPQEASSLPTAVSAAVLPDGRVIYWDGLAGLADCTAPLAFAAAECTQPDRSRVLQIGWNGSRTFSTPTPEDGGKDQLFCSDQRLLSDGRLVSAGGTSYRNDPVDLNPVEPDAPSGGTTDLFGSKATRLFKDGQWTLAQDMSAGRWYPTLLTLPSGKLFVASGVHRLLYNEKGTNVLETEVFDPGTNSWTLNPSNHNASLPLFARLHVLPDGKIFFSGTGQQFNPFGQSYDEATWNTHKIYDPAAPAGQPAWRDSGIGVVGARGGAFSVLLPLKAPYDEARVLVAGGTVGSSPSSYVGTNLTEIITINGGTSTSQIGPALNNRRWYSSGVLLPDGSVLAVNGGDRDDVLVPGSTIGVRQVELYDGSKWIPLSSGARDRTYHNSAVLLGDGSVLVGGHSPINTLYGDKGQPAYGPISSNLRDPSFERFYPPYLNRGPRPAITWAPAGITWGEDFSVTSPAAEDISKVVLIRLPSATHTTDPDMRSIELQFTSTDSALEVTGPPNANVAPPGYYYLFVLKGNGQELTPSRARIVKVSEETNTAEASAPFGS